VLHGDAGPAKQSLAAITAFDAQKSTHYYVTTSGVIYQLVDDVYAAWHSGMADWNGRRRNINPISLGVTVEHSSSGYNMASLDALAWLVGTLRVRYKLPANALKRWSDLNSGAADDMAGFPWAQLQKRLAR
jgi:N-acetylmuramoyl-L-alanine amidase